MARILTGIQSTGTPHLGNILGALMPAIKMANDPKNDSFLFIANLHTLTQIKDAEFTEKQYLFNCCHLVGFWTGRRKNGVLQTKRYSSSNGIVLVFKLFFSLSTFNPCT